MAYALIKKCFIDKSSSQCVINSLQIDPNLNNLNTHNVTYHLSNEWHHVIQFLLHQTYSLSIAMNATTQMVEFRTNTQRICGQNGIRLSENDIKHRDVIQTIHIPQEHKLFTPLAEIQPVRKQGFVVGIVTKSADIKHCRGPHPFSKQIRIRDASLSSDSYAFEVMLFDYTADNFPICSAGDIIKFERITIKWRSAHAPFYQGTAALNEDIAIYAVIDPTNGTLKHSNCAEYELDDGDQQWLQLRAIMTENGTDSTANTSNMTQVVSNTNAMDNYVMLSEITAENERVDLLVLVTERMFLCAAENVDENRECLDFYWVIWDGSYCENNRDLFQIYHGTESEQKCRMEVQEEGDATTMISCYDSEKNFGTKVKILVSTTDYLTMVSCIDEIEIGHWVYLNQALVDREKRELVYDEKTSIRSEIRFDSMHFEIRDAKIERLACGLFDKINIVTTVSNIRPHHQYQSYSVIRSVLDIKEAQCCYRIMGKVTRHLPQNTDDFIRYYRNDSQLKIIFVLFIEDSSGATIKVIFEGKEAMKFMGIKDIKSSDARHEMKRCINIIMDDTSLVDLCLRSYRIRNKAWIGYKGFDTILIK